jgi:hypothetical protein
MTEPPTHVTVTVSASQGSAVPATGQSPPQPVTGMPDTFLFLFAGVGILILAVSFGVLALRGRANEDYRKEVLNRRKAA